ncbi:MAG: Uma2 family endonuclease [Sandaracinaceae bacterium]|nr:Uma2 family endonuclease [Sandaracinaceae bacterium]
MAPKGPGSATLEDLLAIDEEARRCELIEGELVDREAGSGRHGAAQGRLFRVLGPFDRRARPSGPSGWSFATDADVYFDVHNTLRPDVVGWRRERLAELPSVVPVRLVPDWTCEVLSTNKRNDLVKKKRVYHRHRVGHYWIADPADETLAVYRWAAEGYLEVLTAERGERVRAEPFDAIELDVGVLFGADPAD